MFKNGEGYSDPTFAQAYANIRHDEKLKLKAENRENLLKGEKVMKLVYICSPLKGNITENIKKANAYCQFAVNKGVVPLAVHTIFTQFLDDRISKERQTGLIFGIQILLRCDELWCFGDKISEGMKAEMELANDLYIPIKYFDEFCREVKKHGD